MSSGTQTAEDVASCIAIKRGGFMTGKEVIIRGIAEELLRRAMSDDYSDRVASEIMSDVIQDVDECADSEDWNIDDVRLAIGRVLCTRLGIEW